MKQCHHSVMLICDGYVICRDCEHVEKVEPSRFIRRDMTDEEVRAIFGDEMVDMVRNGVRGGTVRVTKIG